MTRLSVNINKVATLRNARGEDTPDVRQFAIDCETLGAQGITVHPRPDQRHITRRDVFDLRPVVNTEFNIEGFPAPEFMELVLAVRPDQVTLVPDPPAAITSSAGWDVIANEQFLREICASLSAAGIRPSIFVNPEIPQIRKAAEVGAARVELYTKPYADAFKALNPPPAPLSLLSSPASQSSGSVLSPMGLRLQAPDILSVFVAASAEADRLGLGVNAGHDLNLLNLPLLARSLPRLDEVSIGHALISDALYLGLPETIRRYLAALQI